MKRKNEKGSYRKLAIKNISWVWLTRAATRAVSVVRTAITARLLSPSAFGIFGIASLGLGSLEVFTETGINIFLVQEKNTDRYTNSAWIISIVRGILISLLLILTAPIITLFFNSSEAYHYILILSVVPFIKGFINPSIVNFQKDLKLHREFWYRSIIFTIESIFTVVFTLYFKTPMGLAAGLISGALVEVFISHVFISPKPKIEFNAIKIKKIFHNGKWVTAYGIFNYLSEELDNAVVAKILGATSLGIYDLAYRFSYLPISEIGDVVSRVVFPLYVKIIEDKRRLRSTFLKTSFVISLFVLLAGVILFVFANQIVTIVLGQKWIDAVPILKILILYGVCRGSFGPFSALFLALNKQRYIAFITSARVATLLLTIIPLTVLYGLTGSALSAVISAIVEIPITSYYAYKLLR